ncbi:MAG: FeoB-associated Cys-rich membrane protein [Clostridia bacterium]|nr:FeoB-associated Cys-rich membrane protein [Clostridia bacterium]
MVDAIIIIAIALAIGGALFYIIRSKKKGNKCIGCPYSGQCGGGCGEKEK